MNNFILVLLILTIVILGPFLFIWAINTLFSLSIAYGFFEWLAALIIVGTLQNRHQKS